MKRLALLRRLTGKELNEILRDRRTLLTLVLMPLLLYPLLGVAFRAFLFANPMAVERPTYRIGVRPGNEGETVQWYLQQGQDALRKRRTYKTSPTAKSSDKQEHLWPEQVVLQIGESDDLEREVRQGQVDVGIRVHGREVFNPHRLDRDLAADWELLYREDSLLGGEAVRYLESVCTAANARFLSMRLRVLGIRQPETPVWPRPFALHDPQTPRPTLLSGLVPLVLILMTITGAVYPAIDVTAGERERGTLEILVAAPVSRLDILFAKYLAVLTVAMLTALVNLGSMSFTLYLSGVAEKLLGPQALSPTVWGQVLALLLLFAAFFSAVLLALTSFARSFKEAQAYLVPLMLLALMPGILSLIPALELRSVLALVPLLNVALLTRDLLEGNVHWGSASIVVVATLLYAAAALTLAARIFGAEAVLYSQTGGWRNLFIRTATKENA